MKSIKFNEDEIIVTYNSSEKAEKIKNWIFYNQEQKYVKLEDNVLIFKYKNQRFLGSIIRELLFKTCESIKTERWDTEWNGEITQHLQAVTKDDKIFKITVTKEDGTIGIFDFGMWQFGRILTVNGLYHEGMNDFTLTLRNSNLDKFSHELTFDFGLTVEIEILTLTK